MNPHRFSLFSFVSISLLSTLCFLLFTIPAHAALVGTSYSSAPNVGLNRGLAGYWTFDGKDLTQNVRDVTGNGNNGLLINFSTSTIQGKIGQALSFDGTGGYVSTNSTVGNASAPMTISLWIMPHNVDSYAVFAGNFDATSGIHSGWDIQINDDGDGNRNVSFVYLNSGGNFIGRATAHNAVTPNTWYHIVGTWDGTLADSGFKIYINGTRADSVNYGGGSVSYVNSDHITELGRGHCGGGPCGYYNGLEDDVRIYNRPITDSEVKQLYALGQGLTSQSTIVTPHFTWYTQASDNFNRANENPIASPWVTCPSSPFNFTISSNTAVSSNLTDDACAYYSSGSWGNDQFSQVKVSRVNGPGVTGGIGVVVRQSPSTVSGYVLLLDYAGHVSLWAFNNGFFTTQLFDRTPTISNGDTLRLEAIGSTLRAYVNGVQIGADVTDTTVSSGYPGIYYSSTAGTGTFVDDWSAGLLNDCRYATLNCGLVGHWTFDGKNMTQNVKDTSGGGNNGLLTNFTGTTTLSGVIGQALRFDGSDDFVDLSGPTVSSTLSLAMWIKADTWANSGGADKAMISERNHNGLWIDSLGKLHMWFPNDTSSVSSIPAGKWTHVVTTLSASGVIDFYINGNFDIERTDTGGSFTVQNIGGRPGGVQPYQGSLDDVRVYNRVLSRAEISQLYSLGSANKASVTTGGCGSYHVSVGGLSYGTVLAKDGRCWLDRNLGASHVAGYKTDAAAYGYYYQWGRGSDGHQLSSSGVTSTGSNSDSPGHANFISTTTSPFDWRNPQNNSLWQGIDGTNNPCPSGFRVPTQPEWATLAAAEGIAGPSAVDDLAYNSSLRLPLSGYREYNTGGLSNAGSGGAYWTSTVSGGIYSLDVYFISSSIGLADVDNRSFGFAVRCIKDTSVNRGTPIDRLQDSLVGHWTFDGKDMLQNVKDSSGNGNNGSWLGGATTTVPGRMGQAISLNGTSQYIDAGSFGNFTSQDFSLAFWLNLKDISNSPVIIDKGAYLTDGYFVQVEGDCLMELKTNQSGVTQTTSINCGPRNAWVHYVIVRRGANVTMYRDGSAATIQSAGTHIDPTSTSLPFKIGSYTVGFFTKGNMDDVRVYSRALSASEAKQLYNMGR